MHDLPAVELDLNAPEKFGNVAEKLDQSARRVLANDMAELIAIDDQSMTTWLGEAKGYLDRVEAGRGDRSPQNQEQEGAGEEPPPSTEMTLSAVIQFAARATSAVLGEPDLAKASKPGGEALAEWVSSQLRAEDPNWTLDTDPLVAHMSVTGLAWRKRSFDEDDRVFHTHFLPCTAVIINSNVVSVERAPRITHDFERYPYEIEKSIERGRWVDYDPRFDEADPQAPKKFYETDAWIDLDGDGIVEPWTVTIARDDHAEVVRITPRWSRKTVVNTSEKLFFNPIRRFYPYRFLPNLKGEFFPMGFGKLLSRIENTADGLLASITDTARTEGENGGVMAGGGVGLPDKVEVKGNRVATIPTDGRPLGDMFQAFPSKSVSQGSVAVLEKVITLGDRLSGTLNMLENAPASMTATLAKGIIDTGTQVQSAVHRRIVESMTQEFRMFVQMADAYDMLPDGAQASDGSGVAVTADPQLATEMQRSALAGIYKELLEIPGVFNPQAVGLRLLQTLRIPTPEQLIAPPQPMQASPWEKMQGAIGLMKQQTEKMKTIAAVAVQLTQAQKNMVEASGGMLNNQAALLNMAQLEHAVQQLMTEAGSAGNGLDNMAGQSGNPNAGTVPAPQAGGGGATIPDQSNGGPADAGAGGGVS